MKIKMESRILVETSNSDLIVQIKKENTFPNPQYQANRGQGRSNYCTPRYLHCYTQNYQGITINRGFYRRLLELCEKFGEPIKITDNTTKNDVTYPCFPDSIKLRDYQEAAVEAALKVKDGIVISPTGSGKTLMALSILQRLGQKTLIVCHRKELALQWISVIKKIFNIDAGFIGDGKFSESSITVALIQSLFSNKQLPEPFLASNGLVIFDEAHHIPSSQFMDVQKSLPAMYRYGFSATVNRRDGLENMIYNAIGNAVYEVSRDDVEEIGATVPITIVVKHTGFTPNINEYATWNDFINSICENDIRTAEIAKMADNCRCPVLVLVDRVAHAERISLFLKDRGAEHLLITGKSKDKAGLIEQARSCKICVATTSLIGEGIDVAIWQVLLMASPISSEIKLLQAIGRVVRKNEGKTQCWVCDLLDHHPFAFGSFKNRKAIYEKKNIKVIYQ